MTGMRLAGFVGLLLVGLVGFYFVGSAPTASEARLEKLSLRIEELEKRVAELASGQPEILRATPAEVALQLRGQRQEINGLEYYILPLAEQNKAE